MEQEERKSNNASERLQHQTRRVSSSTVRIRKPNPYAYYKKLTHDFKSLEDELQDNVAEQAELNVRLENALAKQKQNESERQQQLHKQWAQERKRHIEAVLQQKAGVQQLHSAIEDLNDQELRLMTEIEVLQEKQCEVNQSEAKRIQELIHTKTNLLDRELTKGQMDLEYLTQMVTTAHLDSRNRLQQSSRKSTEQSEAVYTVVKDIQGRRQKDFEATEAAFTARMASFEREREALSARAEEIHVRKQRALRILSSNQQQAITGFFTSHPTRSIIQHDKNPSMTTSSLDDASDSPHSLDFSIILQSLDQRSDQIGKIQNVENAKQSGRRQRIEALQQARATIENSENRLKSIEHSIVHRTREETVLQVIPSARPYNGMWGVESYPPSQYQLVYFIRAMVFQWMDKAISIADAKPDKILLELEVKNWTAAHFALEQEAEQQSRAKLAGTILVELFNEMVEETAADIRQEFLSSSERIRKAVAVALDSVFFNVNSQTSLPGKRAGSTTSSHSPAISSDIQLALFHSSYDYMKMLRMEHTTSISDCCRGSVQFLHQMSQPIVRRGNHAKDEKSRDHNSSATINRASSPAKKRFGLFGLSSKPVISKSSDSGASTSINSRVELDVEEREGPPVTMLDTDSKNYIHPPEDQVVHRAGLWQQMEIETQTLVIPAVFAPCTCLKSSLRGDLIVNGTAEGELLIWSLLADPPMLVKVHSPGKLSRSSITKVALSANSTRLISVNKLNVVCIWKLNPITKVTAHTSECFALDIDKLKPSNLELLMELNANVLAQPSISTELQAWLPSVLSAANKHPLSPHLTSAVCFFSSMDVFGGEFSVVCGTSTGQLLKSNFIVEKRPPTLLYGGIEAKFDAPGLIDSDKVPLNRNAIRREFFHSHSHAVLFVCCFLHKSSYKPQILSIDSEAQVLVWNYDPKYFAGYGWFVPTQRLQLNLEATLATLNTSSKGEMLQIEATADENCVVVMVFHENPAKKGAGTLRFVQLRTDTMEIYPVRMEVAYVGNIAPRFALSPSTSRGDGHFLLLLMNNSLSVYSLDTGTASSDLIAMHRKGDPALSFNSISCNAFSNDGKIVVLIAGNQHSRILVFKFALPSNSVVVK